MPKTCEVRNLGRAFIGFHDGFRNSIRSFMLAPGETIRVDLADEVVPGLTRTRDLAVVVLGEAEPPRWSPPSLVRYRR